MKISDYSYFLPQSLIAKVPPTVRGSSRLLVVDRQTGNIQDRLYTDIVDYLCSGDLLILNDTKVIKARLKATKENGAIRELIILEKHGRDDKGLNKVLYRGKINVNDKLTVGGESLFVEAIEDGGLAIVRSEVDLLELAERYGKVPLPPYLGRDAVPMDAERYQTIWAKNKGSVAAPTASLNMTDDILTTLKHKGVQIAYITLHVGLGTFLPIRSDKIEDHQMHSEYFEIPKSVIEVIKTTQLRKKQVIAVGTTVARTLEFANDSIKKDSLKISGEADIFIYPGYKFKIIDGLLTNFHAPKSTVLMLTAAFAGWDNLMNAYDFAIENKYNFLSYGDSMLITQGSK